MTAIILVPILFMDDKKKLLCSLKPEEQLQRLNSLLDQGFKIKIMSEFEYEHIHFTHYVLEKDTAKEKN